MTETTRQEAVAALRRLADLLESNDDLPVPALEARWHQDGPEQRARTAHIRRLLGGEWAKNSSGSTFWLSGSLGPIGLTIFADRKQVCVRRVVGTETVTIPAVEAQPERTEVRDVVEWDCEPVTLEAMR